MKSILVTGGAGFVGSWLAMGLRAAYPHCKVAALDNLKRRGSELNLRRLNEAGVAFVHGDIRNTEDIEAAGPFDLVVECSAEPSAQAGIDESPAYVVQTNLGGTLNCLEAARKCRAGIVFLSTSRVYPIEGLRALTYEESSTRFVLSPDQASPGVSANGLRENFPLEGTRSLYGATKLCSEYIIKEYLAMYGMQGVINRCGLIAGPWQMGKSDQGVIALWVARHVYGKDLAYIGYGGEGKQVRDVLHIEDLLRLVLLQVEHFDSHTGRIYNVGGGLAHSVSLQELTAICREATGHAFELKRSPETREADIPLYITDNARVTAATGWRPEKNVHTTVAELAEWIRGHEEALRPILG